LYNLKSLKLILLSSSISIIFWHGNNSENEKGLWQKEQLLNSSICLNYMPLTSTKDDQRVYNKNKTEKKMQQELSTIYSYTAIIFAQTPTGCSEKVEQTFRPSKRALQPLELS